MTTSFISEDAVEQGALRALGMLGYQVKNGPDIAPDGLQPERGSYESVLLLGRLREALMGINPQIPAAALERVIDRLTRPETPDLLENNRRFHTYLTAGFPVEFQANGRTEHQLAWLVDWDRPENNDWLAVNQFTVIQKEHNRRPDIVIFVNGLPLGVIELKNPADQNATVLAAYNQLQTYKQQIPDLFIFNDLLVASDGLEAHAGTLSAPFNWFLPWKTVNGDVEADSLTPQLDVLLEGMFQKERLLDIIRNFIVFQDEHSGPVKKMAAYHQYYAVNKAIEKTVEASSTAGDHRAGVVWHTQGSGKSLSMTFYTGKLVREARMANPTVVLLTDRNDLDDQLFGVFAGCKDLLRQTPLQADSRADLQRLLRRETGGVIFTTVGKVFPTEGEKRMPELSARRNIVVIADEAHRSQYNFIDGFARYVREALPNASFIGFTGTPIEAADRNTPAVFGDYIDVYDIERAVNDGATVRIYYESRLAKIELDPDQIPTIDDEVADLIDDEELEQQERLKTKWAAVEKLVGADKRIGLVAQDIVDHWEARLKAMPDGKAMIVCMSRRICVDLYEAIRKLRPAWHSASDQDGVMKVVMTGSATDPLEWQDHIRNKARREGLASRFKDATDGFKLVIVRDMWLTGFDCPSLNTMYADKPMRGHGLMQAIARVNRVFRDKEGGLVVDYIGLAPQLRQALSEYTRSGGKGRPSFDQSEAVALMKDKHEIVRAMFHGFDLTGAVASPASQKIAAILSGAEHILAGHPTAQDAPEDRRKRFIQASEALRRAHSLSVPHEDAVAIADELGYILAIKARLQKVGNSTGVRTAEEIDLAISQLVSQAVVPDGVIDIFAEAGIQRPEISILSEQFLRDVQEMEHRNYAAEALQRLLQDEIRIRSRSNTVQANKFSELLERSIRRYQNRAIEAAQVIMELIELARAMRAADERGEKLGMSNEELAFYDALATNDSAVEVMGNDQLKVLALELLNTVRENTTIDWTVKESVRARLRVLVRRALRKFGYPPDLQDEAVKTVLRQAEALAELEVA